LFFLIGSCASEKDEGTDQADREESQEDAAGELAAGEQAEPGDGLSEVASLFGEDVLRQIGQLQVAINLYVEERVQLCMAESGHEYQPRPLLSIRYNIGLPLGAEELAQLQNMEDLNATIRSRLTEVEQQEWSEARAECSVRESIPHPLAEEDTWYADAEERASELTAADPRVIDASTAAGECLAQACYAHLEEDLAALDSEAQAVVLSVSDGTISEETARAELNGIAAEEAVLSDAYDACHKDRIAVEREVFTEYFQQIAEDEELLAAEWAKTVEEDLDKYSEQLAYLDQRNE
jgi:hypothetical protein